MDDEYCHCYDLEVGRCVHSGKIVGCHLSLVNGCCGGYITEGYLKKIREYQKGIEKGV
jgi:hypothetical protein